MALLEGKVGPQSGSTGSAMFGRFGRTGELVTTDGQGRYDELASRGQVFTFGTAAAGVTVAAANVIAAANSAPIVGLNNPTGNGYKVSIIRLTWMVSSGTMGAGGLVWGFAQQSKAQDTGTPDKSLVNTSTYQIGDAFGLRSFSGVGAWTGVTSVILRPVGGATTGAAAANANLAGAEETAGELQIYPGQYLGLFAAAAGTSPIISAGLTIAVTPLLA